MHRNDTALHDELVDVLNVLIAEAPKVYSINFLNNTIYI